MKTQMMSLSVFVLAQLSAASCCGGNGAGNGAGNCAALSGSQDRLDLGACSCNNACTISGCSDCLNQGLCQQDCGCYDHCVGNLAGLGACGIDTIYPEILNDNLGTSICIGDNAFTECCSCLPCGVSGNEYEHISQSAVAVKSIPAIQIEEDVIQEVNKAQCQEARYELEQFDQSAYTLNGALTKTSQTQNTGDASQVNSLSGSGSSTTDSYQYGNKDISCGDCGCDCGYLLSCTCGECCDCGCQTPNEVILNEIDREIREEISELINKSIAQAIEESIRPVDLNRNH